jgi:hypothetical protein
MNDSNSNTTLTEAANRVLSPLVTIFAIAAVQTSWSDFVTWYAVADLPPSMVPSFFRGLLPDGAMKDSTLPWIILITLAFPYLVTGGKSIIQRQSTLLHTVTQVSTIVVLFAWECTPLRYGREMQLGEIGCQPLRLWSVLLCIVVIGVLVEVRTRKWTVATHS